jgi:hypothetical protein
MLPLRHNRRWETGLYCARQISCDSAGVGQSVRSFKSVQGDLTDLKDVSRIIEGCKRLRQQIRANILRVAFCERIIPSIAYSARLAII